MCKHFYLNLLVQKSILGVSYILILYVTDLLSLGGHPKSIFEYLKDAHLLHPEDPTKVDKLLSALMNGCIKINKREHADFSLTQQSICVKRFLECREFDLHKKNNIMNKNVIAGCITLKIHHTFDSMKAQSTFVSSSGSIHLQTYRHLIFNATLKDVSFSLSLMSDSTCNFYPSARMA